MARFDRTVANITNALRNRMTVYMNAILYTRNLFEIKPNLTQKDFSNFVGGMELAQNFPGIQTIGYVERSTRFQAKKRLRELHSNIENMTDGDPNEILDFILFLEQMQPNAAASIGINLGASAERKEAMDQARDLGVPVATDRVTPLRPTTTPTFAFLLFAPRYAVDADISTVEARRKAIRGFLYAGFRATNLFGRAAHDLRIANPNIAVRVYDGKGTDPERLMLAEGDFDSTDPSYLRVTELNAANHTWTIEIAAPSAFGLSFLKWSPLFVFLLGLVLSVAVVASMIKSDLLQENLVVARQEADNASQAKSLFLANMSHEIRTPLGIIIGFAENAIQETDANQKQSYLRTILRNGHELARIIGDILDLSKIEAKTLMIEHRPMSPLKVCQELVGIFRPLAAKKGLEFQFEAEKNLPELISSDATRIKQVLINLLSNAIKFTSEGEIKLLVERTARGIKGDSILFTVEDTGIGIPDENRKSLFKAFSQGDSSITRKYGGNGLGLAISKELAHALGGELSVDPMAQSRGSRFRFKIPLIELSQILRTPGPAENSTSLQGRKILLVEDSLDNQMLVEMILKKSGIDVTIADNGSEGVKKALAGNFDLILMDIQMPVMDGYAAFEKLREKGVNVPVIALTAHALKDEQLKALEMGFSAYLTKPIDRAALLKASSEAIL